MTTARLLPTGFDDSASGWERALYAFLAEKQRRSGSMRTVQSYSRMLQDFFGRLGKPPDAVTGQDVFAYAHGIGLSGRVPSSVTVGARAACVSSFYRFLIRMGAATSNPCDVLERPKVNPALARGLTAEQVRTLLAVIPDTPAGLRDRAIFLTLVLTGRRRSEVLNLTVADLSFEDETVFYQILELIPLEMQDTIARSAATLAAAGAMVSDVMLPDEFSLASAAASIVSAEGAAFNAERRAAETSTEVSAYRQRTVELVPATYYVQARRARTWLSIKVTELMAQAGLDALLMAVAPGAAPVGIESTGDASLLTPWSFLGFPAITVNGGLSAAGLPLGLQFVGAPKMDWELMRLGAWCSDTLGRLPAPEIR